MPDTKLRQHRWMEMTYVPVEVVVDSDKADSMATFPLGDPIVGVSCFDCHEPLNLALIGKECPGDAHDAHG